MKPSDEPAIKRTADAASSASQRQFLNLNKAQLSLLCATGVLSGWNPSDLDCQRYVLVATSFMMLAALGVGIALKIGKYDDRWFRCRAIAENVKSAMWRYVMSSTGDSADNGRRVFRAQVAEIQERMSGLSSLLAVHHVDGPDITTWMDHTRRLADESKLSLFREERLQDQIIWYSKKAKFNAEWEGRWQWTVFVLEFVAVGVAGLQAWQIWTFNPVGGIATISAALVAWTQTKRHSDLANSYWVAAEDLRRIAANREGVFDPVEVQTFIDEVETAVSREHSLWLSKRAS